MRRFGLVVIFSGLTAALVSTALVAATSRPPDAAGAERGSNTVGVVVATAFVPAGTTLDRDHLATRPAQVDLVPDGTITDIQTALGRTALVPLFRDEPLLKVRLSGDSAAPAGLVRPGRTVFALPANSARAAGGIIQSGDRIAIVGTPRADTPAIVMQDVTVLGVAGEAPFSSAAGGSRTSSGSSSPIAAPAPSDATAQKILLLDVSLDQASQLATLIDANKYYVALTGRAVMAGGAK